MPKSSPGTLAGRIAYIHELSGLDRAQMSELAGLSQSHVGMLVRGDVKRPASETLIKIAQTFDVPLEWLLTGSGEAPTKVLVRAAVQIAQSRPVPAAVIPARRAPRKSRRTRTRAAA